VSTPITKDDCASCGACCVAWEGLQRYIPLSPGDAERLGPTFVSENVVEGEIRTRLVQLRRGRFAGRVATVCAALRGTVGHAAQCGVYQARPRVCREALEPGDDACQTAREGLVDMLGRSR
jgi:Fe-S-cluster containining protein